MVLRLTAAKPEGAASEARPARARRRRPRQMARGTRMLTRRRPAILSRM
ncbi:hypothetical protein C7S16_3680 [Burkholderia thailandensis]|uniref:Uncharacterized protein n=1 Tax=Burkholderia thailandensis TaxID=57975 RepID=A0AAW9D0X1_BURTH|nr:hypothetical protein [Burkholderia thailandensis]MDW9256505.1 hypothetical protein [Burkholderia thailandensis]